MPKKNLTNQANNSSNSIVELSNEDLQQVIGGINSRNYKPRVPKKRPFI